MRFDALTLFGLFAVTAMLLCYAFEDKGRQHILGFSVACLLGSVYGSLHVACILTVRILAKYRKALRSVHVERLRPTYGSHVALA